MFEYKQKKLHLPHATDNHPTPTTQHPPPTQDQPPKNCNQSSMIGTVTQINQLPDNLWLQIINYHLT